MTIDTNTLLQNVELTELIAADLGQPLKVSGKYSFFKCPFHADGTPSFAVTADRYYCFGCHASGDGIRWLMDYRGLSFLDACDHLSPSRLDTNHARQAPTRAIMDKQKPRPDDMQDAWREIIEVCQGQLWSDKGKGARAYLAGRGLNDSILQSPFFKIGYSVGQKIAGVWVDKGIILPCFTGYQGGEIYIDYIKIRRGKSWIYRPEDQAKYRKLYGGRPGLWGSETISGAACVFVTEGEFDAMLLHQEAGDMVGVCTLGSASDLFDWERWGRYLIFARLYALAYDNDDAGDKAAAAWQTASRRAIRVNAPGGKDISESWLAGVDLAAWVIDILKANNL